MDSSKFYKTKSTTSGSKRILDDVFNQQQEKLAESSSSAKKKKTAKVVKPARSNNESLNISGISTISGGSPNLSRNEFEEENTPTTAAANVNWIRSKKHTRSVDGRKKKNFKKRSKTKAKKEARLLAAVKLEQEKNIELENQKGELLKLRTKVSELELKNLSLLKERGNGEEIRNTSVGQIALMKATNNQRPLGRVSSRRTLLNTIKFRPINLSSSVIKDLVTQTDYKLAGCFGEVRPVELKFLYNTIAAAKTIAIKSSSPLHVYAEACVTQSFSGHVNFPYCFGFIQPDTIVMNFLGKIDEDGKAIVRTLNKEVGKKQLSFDDWKDVLKQLVEAFMFMHKKKILHNDIKMDNVILGESKIVKIIDFGKATSLLNPVIYNLTKEEKEIYNIKHRHLAYELRNIPKSKQSIMTDTYSVGYLIKYIGYYENIRELYDIGRCLKAQNIEDRMTLQKAIDSLQNLSTKH